ncbi:DUF2955 domain-containing protein [Photobacterium sagamiensis]|uniref:DUF2955 domain-containing protein n=1 Tax=Photobacterium sagamiensis TaxID=2910241 RepID=UPI003D11F427
MSTTTPTVTIDSQAIYQRRVIRYVLGLVIACALAFGIGWGLSFITPVFLTKFLADHKKPTAHTIYELILAMVLTVLIGLSVSMGVTHYPLILLLLVGLLMFIAYYLFMDPQWNLFATILMVAVMLLPYMGIISSGLAVYIAVGLSVSGVVAVVLFALLHLLLPDLEPVSNKQPIDILPPEQRAHEAMKALVIAFPVIIFFYYFQITGALLTMAFIGILSLQTAGQKSIKISMFLLLTNGLGGLLAILFYECLVMVPTFPFLLALIALIGCVIGAKIYQQPEKAPIWAGVMSALLVVLGSAITSDSKLIDVSFYIRIGQILLASAYMVFVSYLLESWQKASD